MILSEENFLGFAMKHYENPQCITLAEFEEDLKRLTYLKRLLTKYHNLGVLHERKILNHLIILFNVFDNAAINMLFFRMEKNLWSALVTFLTYLERMPEWVTEHSIQASEITLDQNIIDILRKV